MVSNVSPQKVIVVGAGPVGALAALYAAQRGDDVHVYELRDGTFKSDCHTKRFCLSFGQSESIFYISFPHFFGLFRMHEYLSL